MEINLINNKNIAFGSLVSTPLLLRAGIGKIRFEEAKLLNNEIGVRFSGHIGFHKRALEIAKKVAMYDKKLAKIFTDLRTTPENDLDSKISSYTLSLGERIDINI